MVRLSNSVYRFWIFVVGVIATIAYRLVVVLNHYSQFWVEVAWYVGTVGFIWYFGHRWLVETQREELIKKLELTKKVTATQEFNPEDKAALVYIIKSLSTSLARWNYIAIFFFSFIAMAYAIYIDFLK
ncbi:MAG: hypothetical protein WCW02_02335 [Candidatus Buchananbacteria bacterium]